MIEWIENDRRQPRIVHYDIEMTRQRLYCLENGEIKNISRRITARFDDKDVDCALNTVGLEELYNRLCVRYVDGVHIE